MPTLPDSDVGRTVTVVCPPPRMRRRIVQCNRSASSTSGFNGGADGWASLVREVSAPLTPGERRVRSRSAGPLRNSDYRSDQRVSFAKDLYW